MQARDVMTRTVIALEPGTELREVVDVLPQVHFTGLVRRARRRDAARIAAENVPGVRGVEDERRLERELQTAF
ncbi:hypothetical protein [Variovorax sp. J31P207]|uniref:hypothetical protein n=1 Tax=Variovorax sp. J31P207 TaxID=3053510 RepID=UPI002576548F|nr:hypothetical protein [Variovorax sp. J31P207]MDM0072452.1 hypothetical protein [Variovorax sp. J31P207]